MTADKVGVRSHSIRDAMDLAAKKCGIPGWEGYRWQAMEGGSLVHGCVPSGLYTRGQRKGTPKFRPPMPGTDRVVVISDADISAEADAYETAGKCWNCKGEGKTIARISVADGTSYRECRACDGTGKPRLVPDGDAQGGR